MSRKAAGKIRGQGRIGVKSRQLTKGADSAILPPWPGPFGSSSRTPTTTSPAAAMPARSIFSSDADRSAFLDLLGRSSDVYEAEILAYVLMDNHFHLLVKTPLGNLQEFMRHFNISYTGWYNRRHRRSGHLYQGRYHSFLIDADNYLKEVSRYIHLNPVKIKRLRAQDANSQKQTLDDYPWSSYPGYLSPGRRRPFLRTEEILAYFGGDTARGRRGYARYVEHGISVALDSPLDLGKGHGIVGDADYVDAIRGRYLSGDADSREIPAARSSGCATGSGADHRGRLCGDGRVARGASAKGIPGGEPRASDGDAVSLQRAQAAGDRGADGRRLQCREHRPQTISGDDGGRSGTHGSVYESSNPNKSRTKICPMAKLRISLA